ncbi:MarR family transcriptional regulator [Sporomusa sp.]|jgi:DNA-binding MarR family transcriptional regulator|uniref:MarR family winged helix-turn-helix transcriptional regulator n=1 Tax=Sporomusa sp. TaxID=2078658 RepID=UPI002BCE6967|nr:MarR family transcriptional regulator [Sporomusa sp.]MDF2875293.1 ohrR 2 [Sporomusa sp.]HWR06986.1 MarR family transcriptional regulator [Sporomusa sp.]
MLQIFDSTCVLLAKAEQKHYNYTKKLLDKEQLNITPGQMVVLYTLYKGDDISITELSKKCYLDNSTLTGIIDRLERAGLVLRVGQQDDRRSFFIRLTEAAQDLEPQVDNVMNRICMSMLADCTEEEIAVFRKVLLNIFAKL